MNRTLVLASGSPRRKQLLQQLGLEFRIEKPDVDESVRPGEAPNDYVSRLSQEKAMAVAMRLGTAKAEHPVIVAADTSVEIDGAILGKPESKAHCVEMLLQLSGRTHFVYTGVTVQSEQRDSFCVATSVEFRELDKREVMAYWDTGEPQDKAGSYGLQGPGAAFVSSLTGSYSNVIGLPLAETVLSLRQAGIVCMGIGRTESEFEIEGSQNG